MSVIVFVAGLARASLLPWLYFNVDSRGPSEWGEIKDPFDRLVYPSCSGELQSPIVIYNTKGDKDLEPLEFEYEEATTYNVTNTQQSIRVDLTNAGGFLDGNDFRKRYNLTSIDIHVPAEHYLGGTQYDMEIMFRHTAVSAEEDGIEAVHETVIMSMLFETRGVANPSLPFLDHLPGLPSVDFENFDNAYHQFTDNVTQVKAGEPLNVGMLLLEGGYYTYVGSETTPPCTENIRWYIMSKIYRASAEQVQAFKDAMMFDLALATAVSKGHQQSTAAVGNVRPTQALNTRVVTSYTPARAPVAIYDNNDDDAYVLGLLGTIISSSSLGLIILFICLKNKGSFTKSAPAKNEPDKG